MCQICHSAPAAVPPRSIIATVLCDHGITAGVQMSPSHCSDENVNGPTGELLTKWAEAEAVVQLPRSLWSHMKEA